MQVLAESEMQISAFSSFQPAHAIAIARHFRRKEKNWSESTKTTIADLVQQCEAEEWTVEQLRNHLEDMEAPAVDTDLPLKLGTLGEVPRGQKFGCIYADPPWKYGNQSTRAATDNHYQTMGIDDICSMPVKELAADDAHLHLWTTNAFIREAFDVIEAWGFEYRSMFVWVKPQMGIGNYWRVSHEILLLGIRGNAKRFRNRSLKSWAEFPRGRHSAKPEEIRVMIEKCSPGPYLELFGRALIDGWTVFGNQIEPRLFV